MNNVSDIYHLHHQIFPQYFLTYSFRRTNLKVQFQKGKYSVNVSLIPQIAYLNV